MRRKIWLVVVTLIGTVILFMTIPGLAQEPFRSGGTAGTGFTYQGQLTDGGNPANGTYDFQFTLFDEATGSGSPLGTVTKDDVTVTDGIFAVTLDFGSSVFDGNARWLKVSVRAGSSTGAYTDLIPLTELTPAPYAIFSQSAPWSGLSGMPSDFSDAVDNDSLGGLTCASGEIARWNGSAWECGAEAWSLTGNSGTTPGANFIGTTDNVSLTLAVSGSVALKLIPNAGGTANIVGGYSGNSATNNTVGVFIGGGGNGSNPNMVTDDYGTVGGGTGNRAGDNAGTTSDQGWATVGGGGGNVAGGKYATVAGGSYNAAGGAGAFVGGGGYNGSSSYGNRALGTVSVVGGGYANSAIGDYAIVNGGQFNSAGGMFAVVGGGDTNTASGIASFVGGGGYNGTFAKGNQAQGTASVIGGGYGNVISTTGDYGTVSGGMINYISGPYATVSGGVANHIYSENSAIGGGYGNVISDTAAFAIIGGGRDNSTTANATTIGGGIGNRVTAITATIGGGEYISVGGVAATVAGGSYNTAVGTGAFVGGGGYDGFSSYGNLAQGTVSVVGGGYANSAIGDYAIVNGGQFNLAGGMFAVIGGGNMHIAGGFASFIGGGYGNHATGDYAMIPGGYQNVAGIKSFAAGDTAHATHSGTFVWDGDTSSPNSDLNSSANGQFIARAPGGFWFGNTTGNLTPTITNFLDTSTGAYLSSGGTWTNASDRNLKENFTPVDSAAVLEAVAQLPISVWNYKSQAADIRHMGPMAQDFYAAFALGEDDTHISTVDEGGVALAAIQGLYAQNQQLQAENNALQSRLDALEARMTALERDRSAPAQSGWLPGLGGALLAAGFIWTTRRKGDRA